VFFVRTNGLWYKIGVPVAGVLMLILAILGWLNTQYLTREVAYRDFLTIQVYSQQHKDLSDKVDNMRDDLTDIKASASRIEGYLDSTKRGGTNR
jgi:hypothetical protein